MASLQRYVLIEVVKVFVGTTGVILSVLLLAGGLQQGIRQGLPPAVTIEILPFLIPDMLALTAPACILFAVCSVFGRMSADNEILTLKAAGINPVRIISPVLALAFLLSIGTFVLYDASASWGRPGLKHTVFSSVDRVIYSILKTNRSFSNDDLSIVVADVREGQLVDPVIRIKTKDDSGRVLTIAAKNASIVKPDVSDVLRFTLNGGVVDYGNKASLAFEGPFSHDVNLPARHQRDPNTVSPAALRLGEISPQIQRENGLIQRVRTQRKAQPNRANKLASELRSRQERLFRLRAENSRRLSNSLACFCFALIGIPVAIYQKSTDNIMVFFTCFAPILLIFYPLLVTGETMARRGFNPNLSVWLADATLVLIGMYLLNWQLRR